MSTSEPNIEQYSLKSEDGSVSSVENIQKKQNLKLILDFSYKNSEPPYTLIIDAKSNDRRVRIRGNLPPNESNVEQFAPQEKVAEVSPKELSTSPETDSSGSEQLEETPQTSEEVSTQTQPTEEEMIAPETIEPTNPETTEQSSPQTTAETSPEKTPESGEPSEKFDAPQKMEEMDKQEPKDLKIILDFSYKNSEPPYTLMIDAKSNDRRVRIRGNLPPNESNVEQFAPQEKVAEVSPKEQSTSPETDSTGSEQFSPRSRSSDESVSSDGTYKTARSPASYGSADSDVPSVESENDPPIRQKEVIGKNFPRYGPVDESLSPSEDNNKARPTRNVLGPPREPYSETGQQNLSDQTRAPHDKYTPWWYNDMPDEFKRTHPLAKGGGIATPTTDFRAPMTTFTKQEKSFTKPTETTDKQQELGETESPKTREEQISPEKTQESFAPTESLESPQKTEESSQSDQQKKDLKLILDFSYKKSEPPYTLIIDAKSNDRRVRIRGNLSPHGSNIEQFPPQTGEESPNPPEEVSPQTGEEPPKTEEEMIAPETIEQSSPQTTAETSPEKTPESGEPSEKFDAPQKMEEMDKQEPKDLKIILDFSYKNSEPPYTLIIDAKSNDHRVRIRGNLPPHGSNIEQFPPQTVQEVSPQPNDDKTSPQPTEESPKPREETGQQNLSDQTRSRQDKYTPWWYKDMPEEFKRTHPLAKGGGIATPTTDFRAPMRKPYTKQEEKSLTEKLDKQELGETESPKAGEEQISPEKTRNLPPNESNVEQFAPQEKVDEVSPKEQSTSPETDSSGSEQFSPKSNDELFAPTENLESPQKIEKSSQSDQQKKDLKIILDFSYKNSEPPYTLIIDAKSNDRRVRIRGNLPPHESNIEQFPSQTVEKVSPQPNYVDETPQTSEEVSPQTQPTEEEMIAPETIEPTNPETTEQSSPQTTAETSPEKTPESGEPSEKFDAPQKMEEMDKQEPKDLKIILDFSYKNSEPPYTLIIDAKSNDRRVRIRGNLPPNESNVGQFTSQPIDDNQFRRIGGQEVLQSA